MRVYGVGGNTENIRSHFEKFFIAVGERQDFGGADEGKVFRIEEEDQPFSLVIIQGSDLIQSVQVFGGAHLEIRCGFANFSIFK